MSGKLVIEALWDAEAGVWVATSPDVPGLATESESIESLLVKLSVVVAELMQLNGLTDDMPRAFELVTTHSIQLPA